MRCPGDLLLDSDLGVEAELVVVRIQIDPRADLSDDVAAPLRGAEDQIGRGDWKRETFARASPREARSVAWVDERRQEEVETGGEGAGEEARHVGFETRLHAAVAGLALVALPLPQRHFASPFFLECSLIPRSGRWERRLLRSESERKRERREREANEE